MCELARRMGMVWGKYERNQWRCGVMCAEAPVSVFQLAAASEESHEARSETDSSAEAQPALTVATPADSWGVSDVSLDASAAFSLRFGFWERNCMR